MEKTFEELGLTFNAGSDCITCRDHSCHNNLVRKRDGREYSVHISTDANRESFSIYASEGSNASSEEIDEFFENESDAVKFLLENFENVSCF